MAHIGRQAWAKEAQRRHVDTERLVCTTCTRRIQRPVYMTPVTVAQDGLQRPGVSCPRCLTTFIEDPDRHV